MPRNILPGKELLAAKLALEGPELVVHPVNVVSVVCRRRKLQRARRALERTLTCVDLQVMNLEAVRQGKPLRAEGAGEGPVVRVHPLHVRLQLPERREGLAADSAGRLDALAAWAA